MPPVGSPSIVVGSAEREFYGNAVADVTALKAVGPDDRFDKQSRFVEGPPLDEYVFDAQSAAAESLPDIVAPDSGTGRWLKHQPSGGTPAVHALGGAEHSTDTLANLNTKISDAHLDPMMVFFADQLNNPVNADWVVNALAPAGADSNNAGLTVRLFDDTTEEGVGLEIRVPAGATGIRITVTARAETGPGGAVTAKLRVYNRGIPNDAAVEAWSAATDLTNINLPVTTEFFRRVLTTLTLATIGVTAGEVTQFEITRNAADAGDTLVGDMALLEITVEFT